MDIFSEESKEILELKKCDDHEIRLFLEIFFIHLVQTVWGENVLTILTVNFLISFHG